MSMHLSYKPIIPNNSIALDDKLKFAMGSRFSYPKVFNGTNIPYLQGLCDAGVTEALDLIEAIEEYGQVEVDLR